MNDIYLNIAGAWIYYLCVEMNWPRCVKFKLKIKYFPDYLMKCSADLYMKMQIFIKFLVTQMKTHIYIYKIDE